MEEPGALAKMCRYCPLCRYARDNPDTVVGKVMAWHGRWCPAWKAYEKAYGHPEENGISSKDKSSKEV